MTKKRIKKLVSVLILAVMTVGFALPMIANAAIERGVMELHLYQEGDFTEIVEAQGELDNDEPTSRASTYSFTPVTRSYNDLNRNEKKIYDAFNSVASTIIFLPTDNVTFEWGKKMLTGVINDFPEFFYVSSSFSYGYSKLTGKLSSIDPEYAMSKSEIANAKNIFNAGVQKALSKVDDNMNELQRALVLHDYILSNAYYADDDKFIAHSAYGMFYNRRTVCAGYALAYSYLLHKVGIESQYMYSEAMGHAWNVVKIDGQWYQCDLTWDDTSAYYGSNEDSNGVVLHEYFLKSQSYMEKHSHNEFLVRVDDLKTDSTKYDYAFFTDVSSPIPVYNGQYYYLDPNFSNKTVKVKVVNKDLSERELLSTAQYCDSNGIYMAANITICDGKPFIAVYHPTSSSGQRGIYCIINGASYKVNSLSAPPVGLYVDDDNLINYQIKTNSYTALLDKKTMYKKSITTRYKNRLDDKYNAYVDIDNNGVVNAKDYAMIIR